MKKADFLKEWNIHFSLLNNSLKDNISLRTSMYEERNTEQIIIELINSKKILDDDYGIVGTATIVIDNIDNIEILTLEHLRGNGIILSRAEFNPICDNDIIKEYLKLFFSFLPLYAA